MFESMFDPHDSLCHSMNAIGNLHEVRFPNIYILSNIIYYILPLTVIIAKAIKSVGFSKVRQTLSNMLHCKKKKKFSIKNLFSKCDQIRRKLRIWSHLLKKSVIENFIFCAVFAMYYGDMKDLTGTFLFGFFIITKKIITLWLES